MRTVRRGVNRRPPPALRAGCAPRPSTPVGASSPRFARATRWRRLRRRGRPPGLRWRGACHRLCMNGAASLAPPPRFVGAPPQAGRRVRGSPGSLCSPGPWGRVRPGSCGSGCTPWRRTGDECSTPYPSPTQPPSRAKGSALPPPARLHGACPRLRRRTTPAPTPARSSWGARSLDGGGLRCGDSPDREGLGSPRRQPGHRFARPWGDGVWVPCGAVSFRPMGWLG